MADIKMFKVTIQMGESKAKEGNRTIQTMSDVGAIGNQGNSFHR